MDDLKGYILSNDSHLNGQPTTLGECIHYGYFFVKKPFERISNPNGALYKLLLPENHRHPIIGEKRGTRIYSGLGSSTHNSMIVPVNYQDIKISIMNSEGKQTHRELINDHIGYVYDIVGLSSHDKYKYIIEIGGESVYLSAENVNFFFPNNNFIPVDACVSYMDMDFRVGKYITNRGADIALIEHLDSGRSLCVFSCDLKDNNLISVTISRSMADELRSKGFINRYYRSSSRNLCLERGVFDFDYIVTHPTGLVPFSIHIKEYTLERIKNLFRDRYVYDPKLKTFFIEKKHLNFIRNLFGNKKDKPIRRRAGTLNYTNLINQLRATGRPRTDTTRPIDTGRQWDVDPFNPNIEENPERF